MSTVLPVKNDPPAWLLSPAPATLQVTTPPVAPSASVVLPDDVPAVSVHR